jgi:putative phage-type endonuclease
MKKATVTERLQGPQQADREGWLQARVGKVTASRVADVIAKTAKGYGASRDNYMAQLICERLTGNPTEMFSNAAMEWGTQTEPQARAAYSAKTSELVEEVGFIPHHDIPGSGASPDGFVGDGLIEIKCPNTATHLEYVLSGKPPEKYMTQMQWQMAVTGAPWCDFVSYDPRLPEHLQMLIVRVARDATRITELEAEVRKFLGELESKVEQLQKVKL